MGFLRDPLWQFIGVVIAIAALLLTIFLYKRQVRRKELLWDVIENVSLSSFNISQSVKSTIVYKTLRLNDVNLINLKIWNSGNIEILKDDFSEPITLDFGQKAKVLEVGLLEVKPNNLIDQISFSAETNHVKLMPLLLNSGDLIKLKVLVTKFSGNMNDVKVNARIAGIKQIYRSSEIEPYLTVVGSSFIKMLLSIIGTIAGGAILFLALGLFLYLIGQTVAGYLYYQLLVFPLVWMPSFAMYQFIKKKIEKRTLSYKERALYYLPAITLGVLIFLAFNVLLIIFKPTMHPLPPY